jgi:hypothetical protein
VDAAYPCQKKVSASTAFTGIIRKQKSNRVFRAYDMIFNGAAPRAGGVLAKSPSRGAGADNGWAIGIARTIIGEVSETVKRYPTSRRPSLMLRWVRTYPSSHCRTSWPPLEPTSGRSEASRIRP